MGWGKIAALAFKLGLSVALLWYSLRQIDLIQVAERFGAIAPLHAITAFLGIALLVPVQSERFRWIAQAEGPVDFFSGLRITWIGMFFSQTLPSFVGGDAFRIWYLNRHGLSLQAAAFTTLCDRLIGISTLALIMLAGLPWTWPRIGYPMPGAIVAAAAIGSLAVVAILLFNDWLLPGLIKRRLSDRIAAFQSNGGRFLRLVLLQRKIGAASFTLNLAGHGLQSTVIWLVAHGLGHPIELLPILLFMPLVGFASMLPISVAGWGVREVMMVATFGSIGVPADMAFSLSVLLGLMVLFTSLPGLYFWLAGRK